MKKREYFMEKKPARAIALLPIGVFLVLYLGLGCLFEYGLKIEMGFYNIPIVVAFLAAILVACLQNRALSFDDKLEVMAKGVGDKNIMTMILIFLAAGVFVGVVGRSSAESVAYFMLAHIPARFAVAVLFIVSCFVSTAMGTSCGTITLIVPIAVAVAKASGFHLALCIGSVMGGAMFGDNLSFISDTTIAACSTQGCEMKDKFRTNFRIALPAALVALALILVFSLKSDIGAVEIPEYHLLQTVPYLLVLIGGVAGVNVFLVLLTGIFSGAIIMLATGAVHPTELLGNMGSGASGMFETIMVTILVSAMCGLIREYGGFEALLGFIRRIFHGNKGGQLGIDRIACRRDGHCHGQQYRRHRHGRSHREADERGIRHHGQEERVAARHLLMHLPGHHPLRRADAAGDLRRRRAWRNAHRVPDYPIPVLPLPAAHQLAGVYLPCAGKKVSGSSTGNHKTERLSVNTLRIA